MAFEAGWNAAIKVACEFIQENVREYHKSGVFHVAEFIRDLKDKICTSIEQSKHLIELGIDRKTADMYWSHIVANTMVIYEPKVITLMPHENEKIPAWSLSALLELAPIETHLYKMQDEDDYTKHYYKVGSSDRRGWIELNNTSAIDAAYEMVCWLKENDAL